MGADVHTTAQPQPEFLDVASGFSLSAHKPTPCTGLHHSDTCWLGLYLNLAQS